MGITNIFKKGTRQLTSGVDTWMVEWESYYEGFTRVHTEKHFQAFTNKEEAEEFKKDIIRAHKLIGNRDYFVSIKKQNNSGL